MENLIAILEGPLADLVRKDKRCAELRLKPEDYTAKDAVIELLLKHPELNAAPDRDPQATRDNRAAL